MTTYQGRVIEVSTTPKGDELLADHPAGATVLQLHDAADFSEGGGSVEIDGAQYMYTAVDDDASTITLSTGLATAAEEGANVTILPYSDEKWAMVETDSYTDAISARVPHSLYDLMDDGIREEVDQEDVVLEMEGSDWVIADILDKVPEADGAYIDPDTLPGDPDALTGYVTEYAVNQSEAFPPHPTTGGWSTDTPTRNPGDYIWYRTTLTYGDGRESVTSPVLITGNDGAQGIPGNDGADGTTFYTWLKYANSATPTPAEMSDDPAGKTHMGIAVGKTTQAESTDYTQYNWSLIKGDPGADGTDGLDGVGISSTSVTYQVGNSGTTAPTGAWQSTPQTTSPGQYLWTKTVTNLTDGSSSTAYAVAAHGSSGADGADGAAGRGITGTTVTYQKHTNGTTAPTGTWTSSIPATSPGEYLWTRTVTSYSSAPTTVTSYAVAAHGQDGPQGQPGPPGEDGQPTYTWIKYADNADGTVGLSDDPTGKTYIGLAHNKTTAVESTTPGDYTWALFKGSDGTDGAPGVGITSTAVTYAKSTSGTTAPSSWSSTIPSTVPGEFLWTRTVTSYSSGSDTTAYSVAKHGESGADGIDGADGAPGNGITGTTVTYQAHSSGTTAPTGSWLSSPPATSPGQFLWTRTVTSYNTGPATTSYAVAKHGEQGPAGQNGTDGLDGVGVSSTTVTYQVGSSGTTAPTGAWSASIPATSPGQYLWTRTVTNFTDSSSTTAYAVAAHGQNGADGSDGAPGNGITGTTVTYQKSSSGTTAPTGTWTTSIPATTTGEFLWTRTVTTYNTGSPTTAYAVAAHGAQGPQGNAGSAGVSVSSITPYWARVTKGSTAPTKPGNVATPPSPWTSTEPGYLANTEMYTTERVAYSNGSYSYTTVAKSSAYTAAADAKDTAEPAPVAPVLNITGMPRGIMVQVTNPQPGMTYTYTITDTTDESTADVTASYPTTQRPILYVEGMPDGTALSPASDGYKFQVQASNPKGSATSALSGSQRLVLNDSNTIAELAVSQLSAGNFIGAFALLGALQVGAAISISDEGGIEIAQPDGGKIHFPANGTAASISSHLDAFSLTVRDRMSIQGKLNEISTNSEVTLAAGVSTPQTPPTAAAAWPSLTMNFAPNFEEFLYGLARTSNGKWWSMESFFGGSLREADGTTGAGVATHDLGTYRPDGGVALNVSSQNQLYVLTRDTNRLEDADGNFRYFVRKIDVSGSPFWVSGSEWEYLEGSGSQHAPTIGAASNGDIVIARTLNGGRIRVTRFNPTNGNVVETFLGEVNVSARTTGCYYGAADTGGAARYYVTLGNGTIFAFNPATGLNDSSASFDSAASSGIKGFMYDVALGRFYTLDNLSKRWTYSKNKTHQYNVGISYSWFDSDTAGTGQHETDRSGLINHEQKKRAWFTVSTPRPNDTGGVDDPDSVRIWINGYRQTPDLAPGVTTTGMIETPQTGTTSKAAAFRADLSSARLKSGANNIADGAPNIDMKGNGDFRFGGISGDVNGTDIDDTVYEKKMQCGADQVTITSTNNTFTKSVSFPKSFPPGSTVRVVTSLKDFGHNTANARVGSTNADVFGFTAQAQRTAGTGNIDFTWIAMVE